MRASPRARIRFKGRRIENGEPHRIARAGIALVPEREKVFPNLTVAENLLVPAAPAASRRRAQAPRGAGRASSSPSSRELRHRIAGLLSGGERQMLAIAGRAGVRSPSCCWSTSCRSASRRSWSRT